jgi:methylenetetrahydrofolate--tRNA-(uracil-5-)-methyltransferase
VTAALEAEDLVSICREEIDGLPPAAEDSAIVATGPLTAPALCAAVQALTGEDGPAFFDAIASIVYKDSIDFGTCWFQPRYDKAGPAGTSADYVNCPLDKEPYGAFIAALLAGGKTEFIPEPPRTLPRSACRWRPCRGT